MTSVVGEEVEAQRGALNIIYALAATVDAKDHYTYGHSKKVSGHDRYEIGPKLFIDHC